MIDKEPTILDELYKFIIKILAPAIIAISIKIATQIKREKMSFSRVLISFIVGIGCAYFIYPFVENNIENKYIPLLVGVVAMSGEKISEYIIYKWDIDLFLSSIINAFISGIKNNKK